MEMIGCMGCAGVTNASGRNVVIFTCPRLRGVHLLSAAFPLGAAPRAAAWIGRRGRPRLAERVQGQALLLRERAVEAGDRGREVAHRIEQGVEPLLGGVEPR